MTDLPAMRSLLVDIGTSIPSSDDGGKIAYRRLLEAWDAMGWQDIASAPKDGTRVLLWKEATKEHYVAAWMHGDHPGWCTPDGFEIFRATHWCLPPEPPAMISASMETPHAG